MDSKNIFILSNTYLRQVAWQRQDGEEWAYVGVGNDFDLLKACEIIRSTITGNEIFYVTDRHQSKVVILDHLISSPKATLEGVDFLMWDLSFEAVVEFHHIGIARKGFRNSSS